MNFELYLIALTGLISLYIYFFYVRREGAEKAILVISLYLVLLNFISLLLIVLGVFSSSFALILTTIILITLCAYKICSRKSVRKILDLNTKEKKTKKNAYTLLIVFLVMTPIVWQRFEYIEMTGDAGVYSIYAMNLVNKGTVSNKISIRDKLSSEMQSKFDRDNLINYDVNSGKGNYLPGTYLYPVKNSEYYFQFYPSWPSVMANWGATFGLSNQHYVMVLIYLLIVGLFYYSLLNLGVNYVYSLIGTLLLGTSPLLIYFSKYPTSELYLLFLVCLIFYLVSLQKKKSYLIAGLIFSLYCFSHISSFMVIPILFFLLIISLIKKSYVLCWLLLPSFLGFLFSLPFGFFISRQYFIDIYSSNFSKLFNNCGMVGGLTLLILISLIGIVYSTTGIYKYYITEGK